MLDAPSGTHPARRGRAARVRGPGLAHGPAPAPGKLDPGRRGGDRCGAEPCRHRPVAQGRARSAWTARSCTCRRPAPRRSRAGPRSPEAPRHPGLAQLLQTARGLGLLKRLARQDPDAAARIGSRADLVLQRLPVHGQPRAQLAAEVLGDAHALDSGQPAATLVLAVLRQDS